MKKIVVSIFIFVLIGVPCFSQMLIGNRLKLSISTSSRRALYTIENVYTRHVAIIHPIQNIEDIFDIYYDDNAAHGRRLGTADIQNNPETFINIIERCLRQKTSVDNDRIWEEKAYEIAYIIFVTLYDYRWNKHRIDLGPGEYRAQLSDFLVGSIDGGLLTCTDTYYPDISFTISNSEATFTLKRRSGADDVFTFKNDITFLAKINGATTSGYFSSCRDGSVIGIINAQNILKTHYPNSSSDWELLHSRAETGQIRFEFGNIRKIK
jgi:hypothetical protein